MDKLIDRHLPYYHVAAVHSALVRADRIAVGALVSRLDLSGSALTRALFRLRGLPPALSLDGMRRIGFKVLDEVPSEQLVLGVIGQFWKLHGGLQRFRPEEFRAFETPGYAKAVWDFRLRDEDDGTRVETETRIWCTDEGSQRRFLRYWRVIGPFSGLIRREALRAIKRKAESPVDGAVRSRAG